MKRECFYTPPHLATFGLIGCLALGLVDGCGQPTPDAASSPTASGESLSMAQQRFSSLGVERLIPVRFVQFKAAAGDADPVSIDTLRQRIQDANRVFRTAGIQFYLRDNLVLVSPHFANMADNSTPLWSEIRSTIQSIFPIPSDAWKSSRQDTKYRWLNDASVFYSNPQEIVDFVAPTSATGTCMPWACRNIVHSAFNFTYENFFPHELGHYLGLPHTFNFNSAYDSDLNLGTTQVINPSTGQARSLSDFYDLVYKPGNASTPHLFFSSRSPAIPLSSSLKPIEGLTNYCQTAYPLNSPNNPPGVQGYGVNYVSDCCDDFETPGTVFCRIRNSASAAYWEDAVTGDARLKSLAFQYTNDPNPQNRGSNIMSYTKGWQQGLSRSQVENLRAFLRYDVPLGSLYSTPLPSILPCAWTPDPGQPGPTCTGPLYEGKSGVRNLLGHPANRRPNYKLDVDGDGKRDIIVWQPPRTAGLLVGQFRVWKSSTGTSTNISFGGEESIPTVADFDGDGLTDLAIIDPQPNGNLRWRICSALNCSSPTFIWYGERYDVPLPGSNFDGNSKDDLAVYRPSTGNFWASNMSGSGAGASTSGYTINVNLGAGQQAVPGQYDGDSMTDPAVYDPDSALLTVRLSATSSLRTHCMGNALAPQNSGTPEQRAGGIPVVGRQSSLGRDMFSAWDPYLGQMSFLADVTVPSVACGTGVTTCYLGSPGSAGLLVQPVSGHIDYDTNGVGDVLLYMSSYSSATLTGLSGTNNTCGSTINIPINNTSQQYSAVSIISDMNGDQKPEILVFSPTSGVIQVHLSPYYTSSSTYTLGDQSGIVL